MDDVEINDELAEKLRKAHGYIALRDSQGEIVGFYQPFGERKMSPELLQWAKMQVSDEELELAFQEPGGITTAELLERMSKL